MSQDPRKIIVEKGATNDILRQKLRGRLDALSLRLHRMQSQAHNATHQHSVITKQLFETEEEFNKLREEFDALLVN